jgi:hypothetical protein
MKNWMKKWDMVYRRNLLADLEEKGGAVLYDAESGITVAVRPSVPESWARDTVEWCKVAVAYCSDIDDFDPVKGETLAIERVFQGETVSFPRNPGVSSLDVALDFLDFLKPVK